MSEAEQGANRAVWFDIPVTDLERACSFYAAVLKVKVERESFNEVEFGVLEHGPGNGGCLFVSASEDWQPSRHGILIYLNANGRIRDAVAQVSQHGGEVLEDVQPIGPHGFRAVVVDPEGNRFALHSDTDA